jgi:hypothetical protein
VIQGRCERLCLKALPSSNTHRAPIAKSHS